MLIKHPHNLCSIHRAAAADCNDGIGLKGCHLFSASFCTGKRRIVRHIKEAGILNAELCKFCENRLCCTGFIKMRTGYDKGTLLSHFFKFIQCNGQAAFLDINLLRRTEPEHILPSFHNRFDI